MSYRDAIYGPAVAKAVADNRRQTWSHVQPDGSHVVSAKLRDGRVIRVIGRQLEGHRRRGPGCEIDPYEELRGWVKSSG